MKYDVKAMANADGKVRARARRPNGPRNLKAAGFTNGLWRLEERKKAVREKQSCSPATSANDQSKKSSEDASTVSKQPIAKPAAIADLLDELNRYRTAAGDKPLTQWKSSRTTLLKALERANERAMKTIDPLNIPAFLDRRDPRSYINQAITPEIQARIDAAMARAKTAVVGSSFARLDEMRAAEKRERLEKFKASRPAREPKAKKAPPPADSFHLTSLGEGRKLRAFARTEAARKFLKPLELQKYIYRKADEEKIAKFIRENSQC